MTHKKKRGALHKLGKMLRGTKPAGGAAAYQQAPAQRGRPNPAALTAPLEHSMREHEAVTLQAQLLQEQAAAGMWHEQQAAEPQPAVVPAAIRQPVQRGEHPQWQPQDLPVFDVQQPQHAAHEQQMGWQQATAWPQQQREQQAAGLPRSPFQSPSRGPLQEVPLPQQARPPRPSSGLSECPASPEAGGGQYYYPDAAAAGYAAGMAELHAQGLGTAPGGGDAPRQESWQLRRLHVVHSNGLYSPP